jgi:hypothetical protein
VSGTYVLAPSGEYVLFSGRIADEIDWPVWSQEASVDVSGVEVIERGHVFDRQGSD